MVYMITENSQRFPQGIWQESYDQNDEYTHIMGENYPIWNYLNINSYSKSY